MRHPCCLRHKLRIEIWSDASGGWGGLQFGKASGFRFGGLIPKELLPIVVAAVVLGRCWAGCTVRCMCENEAVVSFIMTKSGKEGQMAHMLRCLFFLEASFGFAVVVAHVPGSLNAWVDAFSCNHLDVFRTLRT